jgi:UDP:flavonoid glycosyltransferase YjiC (YdhE family)
LRALDADVVVTVGVHNDPHSLGSQLPNVHVEGWLPLTQLLPRCSLVICHAGSGTLLAGLAAGLPLLLLPRGADQFENSAASERAGVARVVAPETLTADAIADGVEQLLMCVTYREAAARVRADIEAMPAPSDVVPLLEQLARENRRAPPVTH